MPNPAGFPIALILIVIVAFICDRLWVYLQTKWKNK